MTPESRLQWAAQRLLLATIALNKAKRKGTDIRTFLAAEEEYKIANEEYNDLLDRTKKL